MKLRLVVKVKNRFVGLVTVTFPDGYVEKCLVRERSSKGTAAFLQTVVESVRVILEAVQPRGRVKVTYRGSCSGEIAAGLEAAHKEVVVQRSTESLKVALHGI